MPTKTDDKPAKKAPAKAAAPKAAKAPKAAAAPKTAAKSDGLHKPMTPSAELGAIVGTAPLARSEVVSKVWEYIKKNDLQNPANKREILADDKLEKIFDSKKVTMFEMNKHFSKHLS